MPSLASANSVGRGFEVSCIVHPGKIEDLSHSRAQLLRRPRERCVTANRRGRSPHLPVIRPNRLHGADNAAPQLDAVAVRNGAEPHEGGQTGTRSSM
jgi:hypothetical protein